VQHVDGRWIVATVFVAIFIIGGSAALWFLARRRKPAGRVQVAKALAALEPQGDEVPAGEAYVQEVVETPELGPLAKLPPFRPVVITLLRLFDRSDVRIEDAARLVESDPAVVSELLALVNSPLFGISGTIGNASHAISLVGLERTRSLVSTLAMRAMMLKAPRTPVVRRFWTHSLASAVVAQEMASIFAVAPDLAYIGGMMHDLGRMGLLAGHAEEYSGIAVSSHDTVQAILAAEQAAFGMDHCQAGMLLARAWGLPLGLRGAIEHHHGLPAAPRNLEGLVQMACRLADSLQFQAIHHRDVAKPMETIELCAPPELLDALAGCLESTEARVLDSIQLLDY
jgi:putative nucleotidyltransferase with HDIG domain